MPASPARAQIVGNLAHDRIGKGIDQKHKQDGCSNRPRRQAHDLVVVEKKKLLKPMVLDAVSDRAESIEELCPPATQERAFGGHVVHSRFSAVIRLASAPGGFGASRRIGNDLAGTRRSPLMATRSAFHPSARCCLSWR